MIGILFKVFLRVLLVLILIGGAGFVVDALSRLGPESLGGRLFADDNVVHPCYYSSRRQVRRSGPPSNPGPHRFAPDLKPSDWPEHKPENGVDRPLLLWFDGSYHSGYFSMYAVVDPGSCEVLEYILLEAE